MKKSNMYPWITDTWNPVNGACPHACSYCYVQHSRVKKLYQGEIRLNDNAMKKSLGKDNFIFVGSCFDIFADAVSEIPILGILAKCLCADNQYLLQTKNPKRFYNKNWIFIVREKQFILGTTIETNRINTDPNYSGYSVMSKAPLVKERTEAMSKLSARKMVSIEPIMDFDLFAMVELLTMCNPEFVSIGADSKGHNLPEPPADKIAALITELKKFTEVREKENLKRLVKSNEKNP